jgi:hypothetical protein
MIRAAAVIFVAAAVAVTWAPGDAAAQKGKKKSACGIKGLPLVVGNQWTYAPSPPPAKAPEAAARFIPPQPSKIIITVVAIDQKDGATVVRLDETLDARKLETTITCVDGKRFDISPDAFWFAGEPGGFIGLEMSKLERKGTSWVVKGGRFEPTWREDLSATWKRIPSKGVEVELGGGTLQMERVFTSSRALEPIAGPQKTIMAPKLSIEITGRITLDGSEKTAEMPANWINHLWIADDLGVVQVLNSFFHQYTLIDFKTGQTAPPVQPKDAPADKGSAPPAAPAPPAPPPPAAPSK